jgi:phosphopentomutase
VLLLDGVGVGALPDADEFGDGGANTLGHVAEAAGGVSLPNLGALGIGNILKIKGQPPVPRPQALYGKLHQVSRGKDTTVGHWEMMGVITEKPFPVYPEGFPPEVISRFEQETGRKVIGNKPASGTEIIKELGEEHLRTGRLIVYTSADSVFQLAAHEEVVPLEQLYRYCEDARAILDGDNAVVRVIARPFTGEPGNFTRTASRRDFSLVPPRSYLNILEELGVSVHGIGKVSQIYAGSGVGYEHKTAGNAAGLEKVISLMQELDEGLVFANLVDFDMLWGHRNDYEGFARGLEEVDDAIPEIISACGEEDLMIITADHGCDPLYPGTDHTREYIPLLARIGSDIYSPGGPLFQPRKFSTRIKTRMVLSEDVPYEGGFADIGASLLRFFTGNRLELAEAMTMPGESFVFPAE